MQLIDSTLLDFGRSIHISDLKLNEKGVLFLSIESLGDLVFEYQENENTHLVVYLCRPFAFPDTKIYQCALEFCHIKENLRISASAGLNTKADLVFLTRFKPEEFTLPNLQIAIEELKNLHNRIANLIK